MNRTHSPDSSASFPRKFADFPRPLRLLWLDPASPPVPRLMRRMLGRHGIAVETPPSVAAALDWLEICPFDLLVADESVFTGDYPCRPDRLFTQRLKCQPGLPLALTGRSDPLVASSSQFSQETPAFTLRKPVDRAELLEALRKRFGSRRVQEESVPVDSSYIEECGRLLAGIRVLGIGPGPFPAGQLTRELVDTFGGQVRFEISGPDARAAVALAESSDFDLILVDDSMPPTEAGSLIETLTNRPESPAICLTGACLDRATRIRFPHHRAVHALATPFEIADLIDVLVACRSGVRSA